MAEDSKKAFRAKLKASIQNGPDNGNVIPSTPTPPVAPPAGKGIIKRKVFNRSHAAHMDLTKLEEMVKENPEMANEMLENPSIPAQVKSKFRP